MIRSYSRILILFFIATFSTTALLPWLGGQSIPTGIAQDSGVVQPENYFEQLKLKKNDSMWFSWLPAHLHNYEFCHMTSIDQQGPSCAWYAAFNAKALQAITQERKQLTAANIRNYIAEQLLPHVQQNKDSLRKLLGIDAVLEGLKVYQIPKLVDHLGIKNYYDIYLQEQDNNEPLKAVVSADNHSSCLNGECVVPMWFEGYGTRYFVPDISPLLKSIKENPAPVVHIMLTVPSSEHIVHAVLITIIKRGDKKPLLLYLNSNGNSLGRYFFDSRATTQNRYIADFITSLDRA